MIGIIGARHIGLETNGKSPPFFKHFIHLFQFFIWRRWNSFARVVYHSKANDHFYFSFRFCQFKIKIWRVRTRSMTFSDSSSLWDSIITNLTHRSKGDSLLYECLCWLFLFNFTCINFQGIKVMCLEDIHYFCKQLLPSCYLF